MKKKIGKVSIRKTTSGKYDHDQIACCYWPADRKWGKIYFSFTAQGDAENAEQTYALKVATGPDLTDFDFGHYLAILSKLTKAIKSNPVPAAAVIDGKPYLSTNDVESFRRAASKLGFEVRNEGTYEWLRTNPSDEAEYSVAALSA
jgi:hypothetical protein